jgi:2-keto-3-deoxy-L-rhamnonate aldolase RhmA
MLRALEKAKRLKDRMYAGEPVLGTQLALQDPASMEIFGRAGFDWASVDTEHSAQSLVTVQAMMQAALGWDVVPFVRPLIFDHDEIRRFLDIGASGLLCPFIETAEDAKRLVDACRYPPRGKRGWNPLRASAYHLSDDDYMAAYEESLIVLVIIESKKGAENAEEILAVDPSYIKAVEQIRAGALATGKAHGSGVYDEESARRAIANKETILLTLSDTGVLGSGATKLGADLRSAIAATR